MIVWDTTLVSRLYPGGPIERLLLDHARDDDMIAITAPTVMEVVRGLELTAVRRPSMSLALGWFTRLVASDLVETVPLDHWSAVVAGRVRALQPAPPTGARRKGTKPEQRAGWILDIQIAACAWTHGRGIATENLSDFRALRQLVAELYPSAPPLEVSSPPRG
ncbi:MAG: type II toxin-antitoxin system VapC family toxin [Solirubrobacteraceae bacterium MAG38_C4-C5]|nr:type II toxin-antitoxin system VapC family toxin [Candidatus Siliceabacter maunaloa]